MTKKTQRKWALWLGILVMVIALAIAFDLPKQLQIDRCLDAGGSFNDALKICE